VATKNLLQRLNRTVIARRQIKAVCGTFRASLLNRIICQVKLFFERQSYIYSISIYIYIFFFFVWLDSLIRAWASSFRRGFMITHIRHTKLGRTPLDEGPARRRDLYLTTHNTHKRQTSMPPVGFFFFFFLACPGFFPLDLFLYC
jgi:hypothetical protein